MGKNQKGNFERGYDNQTENEVDFPDLRETTNSQKRRSNSNEVITYNPYLILVEEGLEDENGKIDKSHNSTTGYIAQSETKNQGKEEIQKGMVTSETAATHKPYVTAIGSRIDNDGIKGQNDGIKGQNAGNTETVHQYQKSKAITVQGRF